MALASRRSSGRPKASVARRGAARHGASVGQLGNAKDGETATMRLSHCVDVFGTTVQVLMVQKAKTLAWSIAPDLNLLDCQRRYSTQDVNHTNPRTNQPLPANGLWISLRSKVFLGQLPDCWKLVRIRPLPSADRNQWLILERFISPSLQPFESSKIRKFQPFAFRLSTILHSSAVPVIPSARDRSLSAMFGIIWITA